MPAAKLRRVQRHLTAVPSILNRTCRHLKPIKDALGKFACSVLFPSPLPRQWERLYCIKGWYRKIRIDLRGIAGGSGREGKCLLCTVVRNLNTVSLLIGHALQIAIRCNGLTVRPIRIHRG